MKTSRNLLIAATIILCASASVNANAQTSSYYNTKHEIGIAIGSGSNSEILGDLADFSTVMAEIMVTSSASLGYFTGAVTYGDRSYIPTISAEYYYHVNDVIGLGGFVTMNGLNRDMYGLWQDNHSGNCQKEYIGKAKRTNFSVMPAMKLDWLRRQHIGLYTKVAVGVTFMHESQKADKGNDFTDTDAVFNFHASLIGFEGGSEHIRGFAELGVGEQGILLAGLRYKF